jgi:hypothetical protein
MSADAALGDVSDTARLVAIHRAQVNAGGRSFTIPWRLRLAWALGPAPPRELYRNLTRCVLLARP